MSEQEEERSFNLFDSLSSYCGINIDDHTEYDSDITFPFTLEPKLCPFCKSRSTTLGGARRGEEYARHCANCMQVWNQALIPDSEGRYICKPSNRAVAPTDKRRSNGYNCGRCGQKKQGHVCPYKGGDYDGEIPTLVASNKKRSLPHPIPQRFSSSNFLSAYGQGTSSDGADEGASILQKALQNQMHLSKNFVARDGSSVHYSFLACLDLLDHNVPPSNLDNVIDNLEPTPVDRGRDVLCRMFVQKFVNDSPTTPSSFSGSFEDAPIYPCESASDHGFCVTDISLVALVELFEVSCIVWNWTKETILVVLASSDDSVSESSDFTRIVVWNLSTLASKSSQLSGFVHIEYDSVCDSYSPLISQSFPTIPSHIEKMFKECQSITRRKFEWHHFTNSLYMNYVNILHVPNPPVGLDAQKADCLKQGYNAILSVDINGITQLKYLNFDVDILSTEPFAKPSQFTSELYIYDQGIRQPAAKQYHCFCNEVYSTNETVLDRQDCLSCQRWCHLNCVIEPILNLLDMSKLEESLCDIGFSETSSKLILFNLRRNNVTPQTLDSLLRAFFVGGIQVEYRCPLCTSQSRS
jgi:hypothetical protein